MRVKSLNCATLCPPIGVLLGVRGPYQVVCHCLLLETSAGLALVDTGMGLGDIAEPARRLGRSSLVFLRPALNPEETAFRQVESMGYDPREVRHIFLTHLDLDHAGGLSDFPWAQVHLLEEEREGALRPRNFLERFRYRSAQWEHGPRWVTHSAQGERWMGFEAARPLAELKDEIVLVPLAGHTRGHAGVAVKSGNGWLLHAGDAYFYRGEIREPVSCPWALSFFQKNEAHDNAARLANQERLRRLAREKAGEVKIFCAHDPADYQRFAIIG